MAASGCGEAPAPVLAAATVCDLVLWSDGLYSGRITAVGETEEVQEAGTPVWRRSLTIDLEETLFGEASFVGPGRTVLLYVGDGDAELPTSIGAGDQGYIFVTGGDGDRRSELQGWFWKEGTLLRNVAKYDGGVQEPEFRGQVSQGLSGACG